MFFWIMMVTICILYGLHSYLLSGAVLGVGLLVTLVGAIMGNWSATSCKVFTGIFFIISILQMGTTTPILPVVSEKLGLDKHIYPSYISGEMSEHRYDRDASGGRYDDNTGRILVMGPHAATHGWLKRLEYVAPCTSLESQYAIFLKENSLTDSEESWARYVHVGTDDFEGYIQNTGSFPIELQRGLVWRHIQYHGCTYDGLLSEGKENTLGMLKSGN